MNSKQQIITTPKRIKMKHKLFVSHFVKDPKLFYLPYTDIGADLGYCHETIRNLVKSNGGEQLTGWTIWEIKSTDKLSAIFHSVWQYEGKILNVCPSTDNEKIILFCPDHKELDWSITKSQCYNSIIHDTKYNAYNYFDDTQILPFDAKYAITLA